MGTWGLGPFENDGAHDLLTSIENEGERAVIQALTLPSDSELDREEGEHAVAAAELVALAFGSEDADETFGLREIVTVHRDAIRRIAGVKKLAINAVSQVAAEGSEVFDLWDDEDRILWLRQIQRMRRRLGESAFQNLAFGLTIQLHSLKAKMKK